MTTRNELIQQIHDDYIGLKHLMISNLSRQSSELSPAQLDLLFRVGKEPGITAGHLADSLSISPSAIAQLVSPLEKIGYLAKETDAGDRRISLLTITGAGRQKLEQTRAILRQYLSELMAGLMRSCRLCTNCSKK